MNNVIISGAGSFNGGVYDEIHIAGSGKWNGDIECREFHISGAASGNGNVTVSEELHVSGSMKMKGNISCQGEIHVSGSLVTDGDLTGPAEVHISGGGKCRNLSGSEVKVSGSVNVAQIHAEKAKLSGGFHVEGDVEAEEVKITGGGNIGGLLNADTITINVGHREGSARIGGIGGGKVIVKRSESGLTLFGIALSMRPSGKGSLVTDTIEADEVDLVSTRARIVRGNTIRIGEGCEIDRIEYSGSIEHAPSAVIREIVQVNL